MIFNVGLDHSNVILTSLEHYFNTSITLFSELFLYDMLVLVVSGSVCYLNRMDPADSDFFTPYVISVPTTAITKSSRKNQ